MIKQSNRRRIGYVLWPLLLFYLLSIFYLSTLHSGIWRNKNTFNNMTNIDGKDKKHDVNVTSESYTCSHVNKQWPEEFPKIVARRKYSTNQRIPTPYFDFHRWNNSYIDNVRIFHSPSVCEKHIDIISVVCSSYGAYNSRRMVRETWGGPSAVRGFTHNTFFLIGRVPQNETYHRQKIHIESLEHQDLLYMNVSDAFKDLTLKRMLGLKWILNYCPTSRHVIYATDDVIINLYVGTQKLLSMKMAKSVYYGCTGGFERKTHLPLDGQFGVFSIPWIDWKKYYFRSPYCVGFGVLLSMDLVRDLFKLMCKTPLMFPDDRYLGLLVKMLGNPIRKSKEPCVGNEKSTDINKQLPYQYSHFRQEIIKNKFRFMFYHLRTHNTSIEYGYGIWKDLLNLKNKFKLRS